MGLWDCFFGILVRFVTLCYDCDSTAVLLLFFRGGGVVSVVVSVSMSVSVSVSVSVIGLLFMIVSVECEGGWAVIYDCDWNWPRMRPYIRTLLYSYI